MCKLLATVGGILDASTKQVKNFNNSGKPALTKVTTARRLAGTDILLHAAGLPSCTAIWSTVLHQRLGGGRHAPAAAPAITPPASAPLSRTHRTSNASPPPPPPLSPACRT